MLSENLSPSERTISWTTKWSSVVLPSVPLTSASFRRASSLNALAPPRTVPTFILFPVFSTASRSFRNRRLDLSSLQASLNELKTSLWTCGSVSCLPFGVMIWVESEVSVSGKSGPGQGVSKPIPTESRTDTQHIVRMLLLPTREPLSELFWNSLPPPPPSSSA
nr:hypothetical protein Ahy_A04g017913 isoform B [Ipomoea batatas]